MWCFIVVVFLCGILIGNRKNRVNLGSAPLKIFSTKPTSKDWAGGGSGLKILVNGLYISYLCQ